MRLVGQVYRAHHPRWAFLPASGEGAALHGGRFNPVGMPALYTALRLETAWLEGAAGLSVQSATDDDGGLRGGLRCRRRPDGHTDSPSWCVARRLFDGGYAGILVPSFAYGATADDVNAVFWRWSAAPPHQVRVIDDDGRLPKDDRSWR